MTASARAPQSARERASLAAWIVLGGACLMAPWPLGAHPAWAGALFAGLTSLSLALAIFANPRARLARPAVAAAWALLAGLVFTALQRVPLPCDWLAAIATDAVAHRREIAALVGVAPPTLCTVTQSAGATELALLRDASAVGAFLAALLLVDGHRTRRRGLALVSLSGGALALVGAGHRLIGAQTLFGIYEPVHAHPAVVTPLLNGNNLAGLLLLAAPITFALAAHSTSSLVRHALVLLGGVELVVLIATESRGGVAALVAMSLLAGVMLLRRRGSRSPEARDEGRAVIALALAGSVSLGALLAYDGIAAELRAEHEDTKLVLLERGAALALSAPPLGLGRGAFGQALAETFPHDRRVEFAENIVTQRVADWGAAFALFVLVTLAAAFASAALRRRSLPSAAAAIGLAGLALQNLVDFSLELPGVAIPAAIAAAVVFSPKKAKGERPPQRRPELVFATAVACAAVALTIGPFVSSRTAEAKLAALRSLAERAAEPTAGELERALDLHPRDPALNLMVAHILRRTEPSHAGPFLNRALALAPHWTSTHLEVARWLLAEGRGGQASIHLARAASLDPLAVRELTCSLIERGFAADAIAAAPEGEDGRVFLERAMSCVRRDDPRSPELERLALERSPDVLEAQVRIAERDCATNDDHLHLLRELTRAHPKSPRPHLALARCHLARKEHVEARAVAQAALTRMPHLEASFSTILRGVPPARRGGGSLDRGERVGEGVSPPPATHAR